MYKVVITVVSLSIDSLQNEIRCPNLRFVCIEVHAPYNSTSSSNACHRRHKQKKGSTRNGLSKLNMVRSFLWSYLQTKHEGLQLQWPSRDQQVSYHRNMVIHTVVRYPILHQVL